MKPLTYMNNSGIAIREAADFYKIPPERILVVFDDISLPPGKLRIRRSGSAGGHNGVKSILYHLQSDAFPRIKLGVGEKPHPEMDPRRLGPQPFDKGRRTASCVGGGKSHGRDGAYFRRRH